MQATLASAAYSDLLEQVLSEEVAAKMSKNVATRTSVARFPFVKLLETLDFGCQLSIDNKRQPEAVLTLSV